MTQFVESNDYYNVFAFECPGCGVTGLMGIPHKSGEIVTHECGTLYIQRQPKSMFGLPTLEIVRTS